MTEAHAWTRADLGTTIRTPRGNGHLLLIAHDGSNGPVNYLVVCFDAAHAEQYRYAAGECAPLSSDDLGAIHFATQTLRELAPHLLGETR